MSKVNLKGLGVALVTPFKEDLSIDFDALSRLVEYQLDNGVDYIVVLGTTAETPVLSKDEKKKVVRFVVNQVQGRVPIVMGVGGNNTAELISELKSIDFQGVSAVLSVTPYYNKPSQEGLFQHYKALSLHSPLPIVLYNVPGRTGVNISSETTLRIARHCSNVVAIKEASGDINQIRDIIEKAPNGFHVISGDDAITTAVIECGGIGVISVFANAFPKEMSWLVGSALSGETTKARDEMEARYSGIFHLMFVEGNPSGVKCMLSLKGMIGNYLRLPLVPVSEATQLLIEEELTKVSM